MAEPIPGTRPSISSLILIPAVVTLVITVLRLVGELQHWSKPLFNPSAGGGAALIGIAWLPFIFGPYFALKLSGAGEGPGSIGKTIGFAVLGIVVFIAGTAVAFTPKIQIPGKLAVGLLMIVAAAAIQYIPWPAFFKTVLAYAYAARIPVTIVMFFALRGNWGTHYDALPPGYNGPTDLWGKYFQIGVMPQLVFWVVYTVLLASLVGGIVAAVARRGKAAPQAAS